MGTIVRDFTGNLNLDAHFTRMPKGDFVDALNITRDSRASNSDQVITGIAGNRLVAYTFQPSTTNICIGAYNDDIKNRVIYFVWNSGGYHSILLYDNATRTITKILESKTDSNGVDILNLQLLYKVNNINIIHRDEGDLLFFNDAYNPPSAFNILLMQSGVYSPVEDATIRLIKRPPLNALVPVYGDQFPIVNVNNLNKKLFQFIYRWVYKDGYKSTWSPVSQCALPTNGYDIDIASNPQKNNQITLTVTGGGQDYQKIQIAGRISLGDDFGDFFLIDTLDRDDYSIGAGGTYNYVFLNDGQYSFLDPLETELIYSYVPDKANAQILVNGNTLVYGGITEGYPLIQRSQVSVQITSDYAETAASGGTSGNPTITYTTGRTQFGLFCTPFAGSPRSKAYLDITIGSTVTAGDIYNVGFDPFGDPYVSVSYTAVPGDTNSTVAQALQVSLDAALDGKFVVTYIAPDTVRVLNNVCTLTGSVIYSNININAVAGTPVFAAGGNATWKWSAKYRIGLIYFDKNGKTNGVVSFVSNDISDPTDFSVTTGDFQVNPITFRPRVPFIKASINHLPPSWAVSYQWVRTENQSVSFFIYTVTVQEDEDTDYYYFSTEQLEKYKEANTGFVPSYTFQEGDRVRVLCTVDEPNQHYNIVTFPYDFEIVGTVERTIGSSNGTFLKIKKVTGISFSTDNFYLMEIYRPVVRTAENETPFFTFGKSYPIYVDPSDNIRYHAGQVLNQTASQPATFEFYDGDVYYKFRPQYRTTAFNTFMILGLMDANYADFWASSVNSNGNPFVIDPNAATVFNPVLVRFGQAYQPGTDINGLNIFYPLNFDEYFRDYGAIMNFSIRDKMLHVYQKLKVGRVPVFGQIIKDTGGNEQLVVSDKLLNTIQYYIGNYGIGDHPESLASNNYSDYFLSNIRGVYCRLSQNGLEPISISHNINNFAGTELGGRDFNYKCYGVFDSHSNSYITALEETPSLSSKTLSWNEQRNGFESFLSYKPEMMVCLNQMVITFKNGQLYTHDDEVTLNTFYGTQYESSITPVFNDNILEKKNWMNVTQQASEAWGMPIITTSNKTFGTNTLQNSNLLASEFEDLDGLYNAAFLPDAGSVGSLIDGNQLTGVYMIAKFQLDQPTRDSYLNIVALQYQTSVKNITK